MNREAFIISLAGLCHDIGKFVQVCIDIDPVYINNNQSLYQPVFSGIYTHIHALYTAYFIESNKNLFPDILFSKEFGEDNFLNLAAMHHKPETPLQSIITFADRLSSEWDRDKFLKGEEIKVKEFKKTRLLPLLEQLCPDGSRKFNCLEDFEYQYELLPVSAHNIFPVRRREACNSEKDYQKLYKGFIKGLSSLAHRNILSLWMLHFESLLKKYTTFIPAARVGMVVPDVSLFHHSRTTASIAPCLYLYHKETNSLEEKYIKEENQEKFLIISGDFFGIQKFIFLKGGEEAHHRSKLLRGRSFAVSLLCEIAADMLCREIGLPPYSVLLNSAGKFYILAPNTEDVREKIGQIEEEINNWLINKTYGETYLGISYVEARPSDFNPTNFGSLWQRVQDGLQQKKVYPFDPVKYCKTFSSYLDEFNNNLKRPLCPLCGKRPSSPEVENDNLIYQNTEGSCCKLCRDHIMIGTKLVKKERIALLLDVPHDKLKDRDNHLVEPIFGRYQVLFASGVLNELSRNGYVVRMWEVNLTDTGDIPEGVTFLPLNGYVPVYEKEDEHDDRLLLGKKTEKKYMELIDAIKEGIPKTFAHISLCALEKKDGNYYGIDALGILKADVDDLGLLFGCGIPESRFTISRLYGLSTQLNDFFTLYIPYKLMTEKRFKNIYTVFSGGDDLFLIGPYKDIIELSMVIKREFQRYVCVNKDVHLSAGISIVKSHYPVDFMARDAEKNLSRAKEGGKNSISIFSSVVNWERFERLLKIKNEFLALLEDEKLSKAMFYCLNEIVEMAEKEEKVLKHAKLNMKDVQILRWRSFLSYMLARNLKDREDRDDIVIKLAQTVETYKGELKIPLWITLYNTRKYN